MFANPLTKAQPIEIDDISVQVRSVQRLLDKHDRGDEFDEQYSRAWRNDFRHIMFDNVIAKLTCSPNPEVHHVP